MMDSTKTICPLSKLKVQYKNNYIILDISGKTAVNTQCNNGRGRANGT